MKEMEYQFQCHDIKQEMLRHQQSMLGAMSLHWQENVVASVEVDGIENIHVEISIEECWDIEKKCCDIKFQYHDIRILLQH